MKKLHPLLFRGLDPFAGVDLAAVPDDRKSWGGEDDFLRTVIGTVRPQTVMEIGTWKGASAIYMAHCVRGLGLDTEIVCVDPHVASAGYWLDNHAVMHMTPTGECGTYDIFLANVVREGLTDIITPFRATPSIAAAALKKSKIAVDMVYIDGAHHRIDVTADLEHSLRVLSPDGLIVCDDYDHNRITGVTEAVTEFLERHADFALIASHLTPYALYTEKVIGSDRARKVVLAKKGSKFSGSFAN